MGTGKRRGVDVNRRVILGVLAVLVLVVVAGSIGTAVYDAGLQAGFANAAQQAVASGQPAPVPVNAYPYGYGPYWHGGWGFGFFGIVFWIFGILLLIGLVRGALGWGRWRGPGGSGPGRYGRRADAIEDWHRELHRREGDTGHAAS
jgi:hypothetical protein